MERNILVPDLEKYEKYSRPWPRFLSEKIPG